MHIGTKIIKNLITGQCQEISIFLRLWMHTAKGHSIVTKNRPVVSREQRERQRGREHLDCGDIFMDILHIKC